MHLALLTHEPFFPPSGGGSAAAVYLVRELVRRGHSVDIFGPPLQNSAEVEATFGIHLRPFTAWAMGRTTPLRTPKYLAYPSALSRLVRRHLAEGQRYDALIAQHSISAVAAGSLHGSHRIPVVLNLLDCLTGFLETWPRWLMPRSLARALVRYELSLPRRTGVEGVLAVSDALRKRIIACGYPAERVRAVYYGYDDALFRRPAGDNAGNRPPRVVMHGSFDHHHLGPIARRAVLQVARTRPEVQFHFIGPRTPALEAFARSVRRQAPTVHLELTGFVPYHEIPTLLGAGDLGITPYQPSTGTHCAFVAKTVEYLALGLPVVSTPLESALQYYQGLEGITFSQADGTGFAEAVLAWLAKTPAQRSRAVEPARLKVSSELRWETICRRSVEFVESVIFPPG